jgi:predicted dehydrogenase
LIQGIGSGKIEYHSVNGDCTLPSQLYDKSEAIVVHSKNITHLSYLEDILNHGKHVLCEKPLVALLDKNGKPNDRQLTELENLVQDPKNANIKMVDAEHYSYKKPSLIFYQNLDEILTSEDGKRLKIKRVVGELKEVDDPTFWRTKDILSQQAQTGLLGDTMCHLLSFISNLGGRAKPTKREYDSFKEYVLDTHDKVLYNISNKKNENFEEGASAELTVSKFINQFKQEEKEESKFMKFILSDDSEVKVDFRKGTVIKQKGEKTQTYSAKSSLDSNEYVNILNHFYEVVTKGVRPLTDFENSIETLRAIYESYSLNEEQNIRMGVYK